MTRIEPAIASERRSLSIAGRSFALPRRRATRLTLGFALVAGGTLGFLPVLGFWMVPLGLVVLGQDIPAVRRWHRRMVVRWGRWRQRRAARSASARSSPRADLARRGPAP